MRDPVQLTAAGRVAADVRSLPRRVARRLLRPTYHRLKSLVRWVRGDTVQALVARVDALSREVAALRDADRRLLADVTALEDRVVGVEDELIRTIPGRVA